MYSRCFKLYCASSISLSSCKVCIEVQEKKKKIAASCFRPPQKGTFMSLSARSDGKEMYKKRVARVNLLSNNKGRCCSLTARFANMVLRKMNIHEHWTRVTRFNPLWVSYLPVKKIESSSALQICTCQSSLQSVWVLNSCNISSIVFLFVNPLNKIFLKT